MTDTKTFAQRRLMRLIESYKEAKKHKLSNSTPSKGLQQSGHDANKKTSFKRDTNSRTGFSPGKAKQKNNSGSILKSFNKNELSDGMEFQQPDSLKNVAFSIQSSVNRKLQNINNKSNSFGHVSKQHTSNKPLQADTNPRPIINKEAGLKRHRKPNNNGGIQKCLETLQQAAEKRPSDHENLDRKKIAKNKKMEDSSKNVENKKSKNDPSKATEANTLRSKLTSIVNSYTALGYESAMPEKKK